MPERVETYRRNAGNLAPERWKPIAGMLETSGRNRWKLCSGICTQHFGEEKLQRCVIHKTRNIIEKTPLALRDELKAKLGRLWNQPSLLDAQEFLKQMKEEYSAKAKKAMDCLAEDEDSLLRFYNFTESHRKTIRNTNLIERVIRETRRRTKVIDRIDNEFTCYRILMGVIREQNVRWAHKSHWRN